MDEAKLISRQIAETKVEIAVCTRLKDKGISMRLGKPVGDLLSAYELKLVDLENQLQALAKKPAPKPVVAAAAPVAVAKPGVSPKPAAVVAPRPLVAPAKPAAVVAPKPVVVAKSSALEPKPIAAKPAPAKPAAAAESKTSARKPAASKARAR